MALPCPSALARPRRGRLATPRTAGIRGRVSAGEHVVRCRDKIPRRRDGGAFHAPSSSGETNEGGTPVTHDLTGAAWFKSSRCGGGPTCVEVAFLETGVGVRDSKDPGPAFVVSPGSWSSFVRHCSGTPDGQGCDSATS
ncbi:DUF397 domain-containing protein [Amycolatopsis azurea]|uniref:DUF397 domain-containing protein n=1 Tax=Amycolatopsis azurea TaxID=36819 RepID=UPI0009815895|nr:DUF397 domain-containing protein [Amycolatopsis azurea]